MQSVVLFPLLFGFACARPANNGGENNDAISTEYVHVRKISGDFNRRKRSTITDFPENVVFEFGITTGNVTLKLARSVEPRKTTPVYTIGHAGIRLRNTANQNQFAVYQDGRLGASVIVKCNGRSDQIFELFGAFTYEGNHYQIEPMETVYRNRRADNPSQTARQSYAGFEASRDDLETRVKHRVTRQADPYGNFNGDELLAPAEGSGLNRPANSPPYPKYYGNSTEDLPPVIPLQMAKPDDRLLGSTTTEAYDSDVLLPPSNSSRRRRETDSIYIEYMVVADYKNLERWKAKVGGETEQEQIDNAYEAMHEYYTFIMNGIDVRFRTATANGPDIRIQFSALLVSTDEGTSPWIQNNKLSPNSVDDAGVLLDFAMWKNSVKKYLPRHDHAGLFTGFDLATPTSLSPIGMGYLNSICHDSWAVSETEESYNAITIHIAAHELGHNIGTRHDGSGNSCPSSSLYLMAPRLPFIYNEEMRSNPWTFSTCSQASIKSLIDQLGSESCLYNKPGSSGLSDEVAGLKYTADQQCNMTYGNDASLCRENLYYQWDSICYAMQCKKKGESSCVGQIFPFEGTPCGDKKWCNAGQCVSSEDAPSNHETCLFGDDPNTSCSLETSCGESDFFNKEVRCCETCLGLNDPTTTTQEQTTSTVMPTTPILSTPTSTIMPTTTSSTSTSTVMSTTSTSSTAAPTDQTSSSTITTVSTTSSTTQLSTTVSPTHTVSSSSSLTSSPMPTTISSSPNTQTSTQFTPPVSTTVIITTPSASSSSVSTAPSATTASPNSSLSTISTSFASQTSTPLTNLTVTTIKSTTSNSSPPSSSSPTQPPPSVTFSSTTEQTPITTTNEPNLDLSFELQTMISLFVASAIII